MHPAVWMYVKRISLLLVLLLALVSCNGKLPTDPFTGGTAALSGKVTDPHGNIWGGVSVSVIRTDEGVVGTALTDDHGEYLIRRLKPGPYRVHLTLGRTGPNYEVGDVVLREGENKFDIVSR